MAIFRSHELAPGWCELERFEVVDLDFSQSVQHRRSTPKERVIGSLGATQLIHPGGSILIREGQFFDTELLGAPDYALKGCTPKAQAVRLSGHWGGDISGCGIFRVENLISPSDGGDPVPYPKRTRIDSALSRLRRILDPARRPGDGRRRRNPHAHERRAIASRIGMGHHHDMPDAPRTGESRLLRDHAPAAEARRPPLEPYPRHRHTAS